ncbi:MAG: 3-oxoacyl-ACP synthase, partial [Fibrobacter sp.]|nr:3-oxoacyl-ACP synthase [Fibrobacter sp.]
QLQTVSGMRALQDANFKVSDENAMDIGIIVGTSEGGLGATYDFEELIAELGNAGGSAFKFPHTVYNAAGGYLSICSGIKGYGVTITTGPLSGLDSIGYSMNVIHDGQEQAMMATGTDENLPIITEFAQKLGVAANDVVAPYANAEGFVVGDGSVSILLEEEEYAKARGAKVYCYALGFGHGRKNVKFGKLAGSDEALDKAIADALADAGITAADVDAVCGFANGCKKIDDIEKGALKRVFGEKLATMPLFEVKERTGEGRAGSAALAAAEAALLLCGEMANDNAYYVAADGSVSAKTTESANLKKILVISYATGGSYSAVVFGK